MPQETSIRSSQIDLRIILRPTATSWVPASRWVASEPPTAHKSTYSAMLPNEENSVQTTAFFAGSIQQGITFLEL